MKQKKVGSLYSKRSRQGYLYTLPFTIGFVLFFLSPLILYITMAFSSVRFSDEGMMFSFIGLENFKEILLVREGYLGKVFNSLQSMLIIPCIILFSFFIATILNKKFLGRGAFRAIFFLPVITASGIAAVANTDGTMINAITALAGDPSTETVNLAGIVAQLFGTGINEKLIDIVNMLVEQVYTITMSSGVQILIFLAGLQTIPNSVYEASRMDGATAWEDFWKITLPMVSPIILVNTVYTIIDQMSGENNKLMSEIYEMTMKNNQFAIGSSMGTIYFLTIFAVLGVVVFILSKVVYYEEG